MSGKKQGKKSRQQAEAPQASEPQFSLRSQKSVQAEWGLRSDLKTAKAQVGLWQGNLEKAKQGVVRQTEQVSAGHGISHAILESYIEDVAKAEKMVAAFKTQVADLEAKIQALMPDAAKAAERAEGQRILWIRVLARLELDRRLDAALEIVRHVLEERRAITSNMREAATALEFDGTVNLDDQRFDALLRSLPSDMARESAKWVTWFLGREPDRTPCTIHWHEVALPETLACHNAFQPGDCPMLTKAEEAEVSRIIDSYAAPAPPREESERAEMRRRLGPPEPVPDERIQWFMLR
jgi:hypothetical protein